MCEAHSHVSIQSENKHLSPLHRLDARVKVVALVSFVALTSTLQSLSLLGLAALFALALTMLARVPGTVLLKRFLWIIPFAGVLIIIFPFITPGIPIFSLNLGLFTLKATGAGLDKAFILLLRVVTAVQAVSLLTAATGISELMRAFRDLRLPAVMVSLLEFTIRYIAVLEEELERMRTARKARCYSMGRSLFDRRTFQTLGQLVGVLFIRSYERGERVYNAMLSRGYTGEIKCCGHCHLPKLDVCYGAGIVAVALSFKLIEAGGYLWPTLLR